MPDTNQGTTSAETPEVTTTPPPEKADANGKPNGLEAQLSEAQAKAAEYLDSWQRERASFANFRKRADKEREDLFQTAAVETYKKLLPVIDDFERAIGNVPADRAEDELLKGFTLIHRKFLTLLEGAGIKAVDPKGELFNPALHEALGHDDTNAVASGHVSTVLQKGYLYGDKVLRPALVRVAS